MEMTEERLKQIIVETVEQYLAVQRLKVYAVSFGDDDGCKSARHEELLAVAKGINGKSDFSKASACMQNIDPHKIDILFVDYLPLHVAAEISMGLALSPFGMLAHYMLALGKPIFVLNKDPWCHPAAGAYRNVYKQHWATLAGFGIPLLNTEAMAAATAPAAGTPAAEAPSGDCLRINKNVLSRTDVVNCKVKKIVVGKETLITALARDVAKSMGIAITRG
jgi:hypothetical protein